MSTGKPNRLLQDDPLLSIVRDSLDGVPPRFWKSSSDGDANPGTVSYEDYLSSKDFLDNPDKYFSEEASLRDLLYDHDFDFARSLCEVLVGEYESNCAAYAKQSYKVPLKDLEASLRGLPDIPAMPMYNPMFPEKAGAMYYAEMDQWFWVSAQSPANGFARVVSDRG